MTALLSQIVPSSQGQDAQASASPLQGTTDPLEKVLNPGPFRIRPYGWLNAYYDSNFLLLNENEDRLDDLIWVLTPGVAIGVGDFVERAESYALLDYSANVYLFTEETDYNGHNQNLNLATQWRGSKLTLRLSQEYQGSFGGLVGATNRIDREFAGAPVDQQVFPTMINANYQFSDKTSFAVDGLQFIRDFDSEDLTSYNQWTVTPWFNYRAAEKVQTSLGANFGWLDIRGGANQTYQQALARVGYEVAAKVNAFALAGCQWNQFQGGGDDGPFFVFSGGLNYKPREGTVLSLEAHRRELPSITTENQNYFLTGFQANLRQRIWNKFSASLIGGYDHAEYESRTASAAADREDDFYYVGPYLDYGLTPRWDAGIYYVFRENSSGDSQFEYTDHQVGVRTSYSF